MAWRYGDVDRVARLVPNALHMTLEKALDEAPELAGAYEVDPEGPRARRYCAAARGCRPAREHARGRRRDLARAAGGHRAAATPDTWRRVLDPYDAVRDGAGGRDRPAEDGLPGAGEPDDPAAAPSTTSSARTASSSTSHRCRTATRRRSRCSSSGDTFGVFQLESPGMRRAIQELRPDERRRADGAGRALPPRPDAAHRRLLPRRSTIRPWCKYPHPDLAEILDETNGVIVLPGPGAASSCRSSPGYSLKDADAIRKAMSKKIAGADAGGGREVHRGIGG